MGRPPGAQEHQRLPPWQPWMSDTEESPFLDPALRKRAVKVKHVKRREKKSEKKVTGWWVWGGDRLGRRGHQGSGGDFSLALTLRVSSHRRTKDTSAIDRSRSTRTNGNTRSGQTPRTLRRCRSAWGLAACAPPSPAPSIAPMTAA